MKKGFLLLFLLLFLACRDDSDGGSLDTKESKRPTMNVQDSLAIVAFYHSMKCAEWKEPYHWDLTDYTTWGGIMVELDKATNEYRVTDIKILETDKHLPVGYSLPAELGNLTRLRSLILLGNSNATGCIPPEIFNCPLEILDIMGGDKRCGGFTGTIPQEVGNVANTLKYLCISNTSIGGDLPKELGTLSKLEHRAELAGNNFSGKVPLFLRNLPYGARLAWNQFTEMDWRYFTEDIGFVPDLSYNHLHGEIPAEVFAASERWEQYHLMISCQEAGYGYDEKYFRN